MKLGHFLFASFGGWQMARWFGPMGVDSNLAYWLTSLVLVILFGLMEINIRVKVVDP